MPFLKPVLALIGIVILLLLPAGWVYERVAEWRETKHSPGPGVLVDVGHRLHFFCQGSVGPTVVIEQGAGEPSRLWWPIQQKIAAFARVCTYDRAGYGSSDPVRQSRSVSDRAEDLHALLTRAPVPGPYLLVAHSYGGLIIRQFAELYPEQVAGLIFVDTADEQALSESEVQNFYSRMRSFIKILEAASYVGVPRLLRHIPALREGLFLVRAREYAAAAEDLASLKTLDMTALQTGALGEMPVVVITHGQPFPGPFAILEKGWMASQHRLAGLSRRSQLITAKESNHMVHLEQPDLVVDEVRNMHCSFARGDR